jgi:hypothetical protein
MGMSDDTVNIAYSETKIFVVKGIGEAEGLLGDLTFRADVMAEIR